MSRDLEQQLIQRLLDNDESAYRDLIKAYHNRMLSVARAICGNVFADDVVQDAWVSVYKALPRFRGQSSLKTWIMTIVSNEARTRVKRESRHVSLESVTTEPAEMLHDSQFKADGHWAAAPMQWSDDSPDKLLQNSQLMNCIEKTLGLLPEQQQAVFALRDMELMDLSEICNILDITNSNARVLLHRARLKLMSVIDRHQETGEC